MGWRLEHAQRQLAQIMGCDIASVGGQTVFTSIHSCCVKPCHRLERFFPPPPKNNKQTNKRPGGASPLTCDSFTSHPSCSSRRSRNLAPRKLSSWRDGSADTVLQGGRSGNTAPVCQHVHACRYTHPAITETFSASSGLQGLTAHATLQQRVPGPKWHARRPHTLQHLGRGMHMQPPRT